MPKPCGVESRIGPLAGIGPQGRLPDGSAHVSGVLFPEGGSRPIDERPKSRQSRNHDASDQVPSAHTILRMPQAGLRLQPSYDGLLLLAAYRRLLDRWGRSLRGPTHDLVFAVHIKGQIEGLFREGAGHSFEA